mmetsp:Transcript_41504/g.95394  ORF Transcript_41504/g.95394 Transcript_41504/m.95394 type:complete len:299 (-) Transcript_41504:132-1028(-)
MQLPRFVSAAEDGSSRLSFRSLESTTGRFLSWLNSGPGVCVSIAIFDHVFFLTMLYLGGKGIVDIHRSLIWTLLPSMMSCVVRVRDDPGKLPRVCLGPVFFLHILHTVMLHQALEWDKRRNTSIMVFIEALTCVTILCADLVVVIAGHNRALLRRFVPGAYPQPKEVVTEKVLPQVDRVVCAAADMADGSSSSCIVCLEDFKEGEALGRLPCLHIFHQTCLDKWLASCQHPPWCPFRCAPGFIRTSGREAQPQLLGASTENNEDVELGAGAIDVVELDAPAQPTEDGSHIAVNNVILV